MAGLAVCQRHALKARSSAQQGLQWAALRCFSSTGEASALEDYHWLMTMAGYKPVIEICGGTEIGGGFLAGSMLQPQSPSTFSTPTMGENCLTWLLARPSFVQAMAHDYTPGSRWCMFTCVLR